MARARHCCRSNHDGGGKEGANPSKHDKQHDGELSWPKNMRNEYNVIIEDFCKRSEYENSDSETLPYTHVD